MDDFFSTKIVQKLGRAFTVTICVSVVIFVGALIIFSISILVSSAKELPYGGWAVGFVLTLASILGYAVWKKEYNVASFLKTKLSVTGNKQNQTKSKVHRIPSMPRTIKQKTIFRNPDLLIQTFHETEVNLQVEINELISSKRYNDALNKLGEAESLTNSESMQAYIKGTRLRIERKMVNRA